MKRVMNPRTVRASLEKIDKRLADIEAEREALTQLHAALEAQLPAPLGLEEEHGDMFPLLTPLGPSGGSSGTDTTLSDCPFCLAREQHQRKKQSEPDTPGVVGESDECVWATGPHYHMIEPNRITCSAQEEQWKR